jgi:N-acetylglutamate synthase-like GNAT family acetyltransferase
MGFASYRGRIMRYTAPGRDLERENFAAGGAERCVAAIWPDLARIMPLYLYPHEWYLLDARLDIYSTRYFPGRRCVGIFCDIWNAVQATRGAWLLWEREGKRIVGDARLYPETEREGMIDFALHAAHRQAAPALLAALLAEAAQRGLRRVRCMISRHDAEKMEDIAAAGFARIETDAATEERFAVFARDVAAPATPPSAS